MSESKATLDSSCLVLWRVEFILPTMLTRLRRSPVVVRRMRTSYCAPGRRQTSRSPTAPLSGLLARTLGQYGECLTRAKPPAAPTRRGRTSTTSRLRFHQPKNFRSPPSDLQKSSHIKMSTRRTLQTEAAYKCSPSASSQDLSSCSLG